MGSDSNVVLLDRTRESGAREVSTVLRLMLSMLRPRAASQSRLAVRDGTSRRHGTECERIELPDVVIERPATRPQVLTRGAMCVTTRVTTARLTRAPRRDSRLFGRRSGHAVPVSSLRRVVPVPQMKAEMTVSLHALLIGHGRYCQAHAVDRRYTSESGASRDLPGLPGTGLGPA